MSKKNIQKKVIDITGVELTPGKPAVCLGNGEQGFECCCDECDYYCFAFLNLIQKTKKKIFFFLDNYLIFGKKCVIITVATQI